MQVRLRHHHPRQDRHPEVELHQGALRRRLDRRTQLPPRQPAADRRDDLGTWAGELPELAGMHKSEVNDTKVFMRRQHDDVRLAYGRYVKEFPRQFIPWGTTNDLKYLKDPTGNRSFWPVVVTVPMIDTDACARARPVMGGSRSLAYRDMRAAHPSGDLPFLLSPAALGEAEEPAGRGAHRRMHEMWAQSFSIGWNRPALHAVPRVRHRRGGKFPDGEDQACLRVAFTRNQAVEFP